MHCLSRALRLYSFFMGVFACCTFSYVPNALAQADLILRDGFEVIVDPPVPFAPSSDAEAARFLAQATFGPSIAEIARLRSIGYEAWVTAEFAKPFNSAITRLDPSRLTPGNNATSGYYWVDMQNLMWQGAVAGDDQLRQRMIFALSQIFVLSCQDGETDDYPRGCVGFTDVLGRNALGNFRTLLEDVSKNPMMGRYLSFMYNRKESNIGGVSVVPDQNYAREIMQLFSIGLYQLNPDGSQVLQSGAPVAAYGGADIQGLSRVFTGWAWSEDTDPNWTNPIGAASLTTQILPMRANPQQHSTSEKRFLGVTIAPQNPANPQESLRIALDRLASHPNVGPFIGKQLIQRLVTSNPSPQYIARVSAKWANDGTGVRSNLQAVLRAILLDPEARNPARVSADPNWGKLREPTLRLANLFRMMQSTSVSGDYEAAEAVWEAYTMQQLPFNAPSVFNFYRPGFSPPGGALEAAGLVSPEMQIFSEPTAAIWANNLLGSFRDSNGWGNIVGNCCFNRDIVYNYSALSALADTPNALLARINLLTGGTLPQALQDKIAATLPSVTNPAGNTAEIRRNKVRLALAMVLMSPEYLVQK
jgi:uncharacterized protein (DUF1800 family)